MDKPTWMQVLEAVKAYDEATAPKGYDAAMHLRRQRVIEGWRAEGYPMPPSRQSLMMDLMRGRPSGAAEFHDTMAEIFGTNPLGASPTDSDENSTPPESPPQKPQQP